jgi:hypothetical protein
MGGHAHDLRRLQILRWYAITPSYSSEKPQPPFPHSTYVDECYIHTGGFYRAHLTFPPEYPHLPPKMTFQTPIFHPNGTPPLPPPLLHPPQNPPTNTQPPIHTSLPLRRRLHLHPARPHQRPLRLRIRRGALVARADARDDLAERDQHAELS